MHLDPGDATMTTPILPSRNESHGFFGTITLCPLRERCTAEVWALAFTQIAEAVRAQGEEDRLGIRDFLDSRMGRHFADDVASALNCGVPSSEAGIAAAIRKWQGWRISRATEHEDGIPAGLPYLTGWVQYYTVMAGMEEAD
jgi:hypothetical protein